MLDQVDYCFRPTGTMHTVILEDQFCRSQLGGLIEEMETELDQKRLSKMLPQLRARLGKSRDACAKKQQKVDQLESDNKQHTKKYIQAKLQLEKAQLELNALKEKVSSAGCSDCVGSSVPHAQKPLGRSVHENQQISAKDICKTPCEEQPEQPATSRLVEEVTCWSEGTVEAVAREFGCRTSVKAVRRLVGKIGNNHELINRILGYT